MFLGELAFVLESVFGPVCYVGIDIDPELKYPKGAARVTFSTTKSFVDAINGHFVNIPHSDTQKRVGLNFFKKNYSKFLVKKL